MGLRSRPIVLSSRVRALLERWIRASSCSQQLSERSRIIVMSADSVANREQAVRLGVDAQRVRRWRNRWARRAEEIAEAEAAGACDKELAGLVGSILSDNYRSGAPAKFCAEQLAQLVALACQSPEDSGLPVSHWTPAELAREAMRRGLVEEISPRHVDRVLKRSRTASSQDSLLAQRQGRRQRGLRAAGHRCL